VKECGSETPERLMWTKRTPYLYFIVRIEETIRTPISAPLCDFKTLIVKFFICNMFTSFSVQETVPVEEPGITVPATQTVPDKWPVVPIVAGERSQIPFVLSSDQ
jgi:hypothetical protein